MKINIKYLFLITLILVVLSNSSVELNAGDSYLRTNTNNTKKMHKMPMVKRKDMHPLLFLSDFSLKDGAVAAMKGVAISIDRNLVIHDITHDLPNFTIWEATYRIVQTLSYWPKGTVVVSVVDPGVGSDRQSVVAKTKNGYYIVTPDNGTLTLIADRFGIEEIREIDESVNRLENSYDSYTFHGRDVYAYTGAKLASRQISFEEVGQSKGVEYVALPYLKPKFIKEENKIIGNIDIRDANYGNAWTNINKEFVEENLGKIKFGEQLKVEIHSKKSNSRKRILFSDDVAYERNFDAVSQGEPVLYLNSLLNLSIALNADDFLTAFGIGHGNMSGYVIEITKEISNDHSTMSCKSSDFMNK